MAWSVDSAIQVQNLITNVQTRLEASGWTLTDRAADQVWHSTNNQGVTQYIQITNCQSGGGAGSGANWMYLQFQGWESWNTGTHAGANGSGVTYHRVYYASANVAAATLVDLYMSVTANRFILFLQGTGNFRHWMYFGGLDTVGGTSQPGCVLLIGSHTSGTGSVYPLYNSLLQSSMASTYWGNPSISVPTTASTYSSGAPMTTMIGQGLIWDIPTVLLFPLLVLDPTGLYPKGNMDGLYFFPLSSAIVSHLDTITVSGVTYLIVQPGGQITADYHPITGNFVHGLAIVEA